MHHLDGKPADYSATVNGFRGLCVLMIFLHHVGNSGLPPTAARGDVWHEGLHQTFMSFAYGVELFFMISGYVIAKSLLRHPTMPGFLFDRAVRIFPVWVPIAVVLCLASAWAGRPGFELHDLAGWSATLLANVLLLPPIVPLPEAHPASWSLSYEWLFYAAGAAAVALWRGSPGLLSKALWVLAAATLIACLPRALFFIPGVAVAMWPAVVRPLQRAPMLACLSLPIFLWSWYATGVTAAEFDKPLWTVAREGHALAVGVALLAGLHLFSCVASRRDRGLGILRTTAAQHLGNISYSFYLVHPLVMAAVKPAVHAAFPAAQGSWSATLAFALASALVAWPLSYLSWRVLERQVARWIKARLRPAAIPASGAAVVRVISA